MVNMNSPLIFNLVAVEKSLATTGVKGLSPVPREMILVF